MAVILRLRLLQAEAGFQPANRLEVVRAAAHAAGQVEGNPDVGPAGKAETAGQHAHDGERAVGEPDGPPQHAGIAAEAVAPIGLPDDGGIAHGLVFLRAE